MIAGKKTEGAGSRGGADDPLVQAMQAQMAGLQQAGEREEKKKQREEEKARKGKGKDKGGKGGDKGEGKKGDRSGGKDRSPGNKDKEKKKDIDTAKIQVRAEDDDSGDDEFLQERKRKWEIRKAREKAGLTGEKVKRSNRVDEIIDELYEDRLAWNVTRRASKLMGRMNVPDMFVNPKRFETKAADPGEGGRNKEQAEIAKVQAVFTMKTVREMRLAVQRKKLYEKLKRGDPAVFPRQFMFKVAIAYAQNMTDQDERVFFATSVAHYAARAEPRQAFFFEDKYLCTEAFEIPSRRKMSIAPEITFYETQVEGSYLYMKTMQMRMDMWEVSLLSMNKYRGCGTRTLWELGSQDHAQFLPIRKIFLDTALTESDQSEIIRVGMSVICQEIFIFKINLDNFQFFPLFDDPKIIPSELSLRVGVPIANKAKVQYFRTKKKKRGRFFWEDAGSFVYKGTRASFETEFMDITLKAGARTVAACIIPLAGTLDVPTVMGQVKSTKTNPDTYYLGFVTGFTSISMRSSGLPPGFREDLKDPTVERPIQPMQRSFFMMLDPNVQYFILEIYSAESVAAADTDAGYSNPMIKARYDGMELHSSVAHGTTRPVWNQYMHFPVHFPNPDIRWNPKHVKTILPKDMENRGMLEIEVWHWNGVGTSDLLGRYDLDPHYIIAYGHSKARRIADPTCKPVALWKKSKEEEEEEMANVEVDGATKREKGINNELAAQFGGQEGARQAKLRSQSSAKAVNFGIHPRLVKLQNTRVYSARREILSGAWLSGSNPTINFDAYFLPDYPQDFRMAANEVTKKELAAHKKYVESGVTRLEEMQEEWDGFWERHNLAYLYWFINGPLPEQRRFLATYENSGGELNPLPGLIQPCVVPDGLRSTSTLLHWIACMNFICTSKQWMRKQIDKWYPVSHMMASHRGSVQDHCTLLCSLLLSLGQDAYVCKGTVDVFPEDSLRVYEHGYDPKTNEPRKIVLREHAWVMTRESNGDIVIWETTCASAWLARSRWAGKNKKDWKKVDTKWMENLADIEELQNKDALVQLRRRREALSRLAQIPKLPIAPKREFGAAKLIAPLPYFSIETVFNDKNVWGNMQNHDPAFITYDFSNPYAWKPFIMTKKDAKEIRKATKHLVIGPKFSRNDAELVVDQIKVDICEAMRFARTRQGLQTKFYENLVLTEVLKEFLDNMEEQATLDPFYSTQQDGTAARVRACNYSDVSLFTDRNKTNQYRSLQKQRWKQFWEVFSVQETKHAGVPVPENMCLSAVPFHFSSTDLREVRAYIVDNADLQRMLTDENEELEFFCVVQLYALAHQVGSLWVFVGCLKPMDASEIAVVAASTTKYAAEFEKTRKKLKDQVKQDLLRRKKKR